MELRINRDYLLQGINTVFKAVTNHTTMPILTGIKIAVEESAVLLTASNSILSIQYAIPFEMEDNTVVELEKVGSVVCPAKLFSEVVKKLPGETVKLSVDEKNVTTLSSGRSKFTLNGMSAGDFPRLPYIEKNQLIKIPSDSLQKVIQDTVFAVSTTGTRPILEGVMLANENELLTFVSTDSHRLAKEVISLSETNNIAFNNVVIPGQSLVELNKILPDDDTMIELVITENQMMTKIGYVSFYSRLLDGIYPDTTRIIPQATKSTLTFNTKEFLGAIERASLLAKDGKNNVVRLLTQETGFVEISSRAVDVGKVKEEIYPSSFEGEEVKISFNSKYMIEALRTVDTKEVRIEFTGPMQPFMIYPVDGATILHLILPVRTNH